MQEALDEAMSDGRRDASRWIPTFSTDGSFSLERNTTLFGHEFMLQTAPNRFGLDAFYMLHAWIYKHNPAGKFEPWNPRVHCPA